MPIFESDRLQRVVFVHIPKTGGTTIESWLEDVYDRMYFHATFRPKCMKVTPQHIDVESLAELGMTSESDFLFAVVRNPYDRIESEFFYQDGLRSRPGGLRWQPDFSQWVVDSIREARRDRCFAGGHFMPQVQYINDRVEVFKFEEGIDSVVRKVAMTINVSPPLGIAKKKASKRRLVIWSRRALTAVNDYYERDFSYFGYPVTDSVDQVAYRRHRVKRAVSEIRRRLKVYFKLKS